LLVHFSAIRKLVKQIIAQVIKAAELLLIAVLMSIVMELLLVNKV